MNKSSRSAAFGEQMAQSMAELRAIIASGKPPTGNGRWRKRAAPRKIPKTISNSKK